MQVALALTQWAKAMCCDKYVQHTLRVWYLYELIEQCNKVHTTQLALIEGCARCDWLINLTARGRPPTYAVAKLLKQWYRQ